MPVEEQPRYVIGPAVVEVVPGLGRAIAKTHWEVLDRGERGEHASAPRVVGRWTDRHLAEGMLEQLLERE